MLPVIENTPPVPALYQPMPAAPVTALAPALPESSDERIARLLVAPPASRQSPVGDNRILSVALPKRIPTECVTRNAADYGLSPFVLLSILKVESNGQTGRIGRNTNGTYDLGPAQFNTNTWAKTLTERYKIPREALLHDMCQAVRALAFAVRTEINGAGGDLWRGIGNYHSRTPKHHVKYIRLVYSAYSNMTTKGKF